MEYKKTNKHVFYDKSEVIDFNEYLHYPKDKDDVKELKINENGDIIFRNKVILNSEKIPLNENNANTDTELKILFAAKGYAPREGCNPEDIANNGSLGCYIDIPTDN